ncbi:YdcF family protein [Microcoleus sp. ZQ-A2]|nr:YdcF family protein [Microcoleus sp. FACHB-1]
MKPFCRKRWKSRFFALLSYAFLLLLLGIIPARLAIASYQAPHPQGILTLGGGRDREEFTAQFAKYYPSLEIWVSSGTSPDLARPIFRAAGIPDSRVHLDNRAVDTVTNFTSLVEDLKRRHIQHIYLITSDFHMSRAKAIATIVLGSQGIAFTPVSVPTREPVESQLHILRDVVRAFLWLVTGRTGASLRIYDYQAFSGMNIGEHRS